MKRSLTGISIAVALGLFASHVRAAGVGGRSLIAVQTTQSIDGGDRRSGLSPALRALKDSNGVLQGVDTSGHPVIFMPKAGVAALQSSRSVKRVLAEVPTSWTRVQRLKISYGADPRPTDADLEALGLKVVEDYKKGSFLLAEIVNRDIDGALAGALEKTKGVKYATLSASIQALPPVLSGDPIRRLVQAAQPPTNDPHWDQMWNMDSIRAPIGWAKIHDSPVTVAVLDTGIDYSHEDLRGNMWTSRDGFHGHDFVDDDGDPQDLNGHGTHCAGTIGAVGNNSIGVVGVNWKVNLMALRWLDRTGSGEVSNAIKAIDYAIDNGATILSNSWFWTEDDPDLLAAIKRAEAANVLFVAAAGNFAERPGNNGGDNDNERTFGRYPSSYPVANVVSVAAVDSKDVLAPFSEWGRKVVHLAAPGVRIESTVPGNGYNGTYSGTSMATPHVAGALALAWARDKDASFKQIKSLVLANVRKVPALSTKCITSGVLDMTFLGGAP